MDKFEIESAEKLYNYLKLKLPKFVDYKDLYNLCFSLFCTLDVLPENLRSLKVTKEVLAFTFVKIAVIKNIPEYITKNDWIELIDGFLKLDNNFPNHENAQILLGIN